MRKEFLPFITDNQGRSVTLENGVIVKSVIPNPQDEAPQGWEESTIQFSRNGEFRGVVRAYTTPLKFFFEAATILRYYFYGVSVNIVLFFIWLKLDTSFGGDMKYKDWYKGSFDMSAFRDEDDGVEINISEGGLVKDLQTNKGTVYQFDFADDDPDAVTVLMNGMDIFYEAKFLINNSVNAIDPNYNLGNHLIDLSEISNEFARIGSVGAVPRTKVSNHNPDIKATGKWFMQSTAPGDVFIKYKLTVNTNFISPPGINPAAGWEIVIRRINTAGISSLQHVLINKGSAEVNGAHTWNIEGTATIPVTPGDELYFGSFMFVEGATGDAQFQVDYSGEDSIFEVDFKYRGVATVIDARRAFDLGNLLCKKMGSAMKSDLLENDYNLLCTSFDAIRGTTAANIKTKFSDYHKSIDAVKCISFGVENNKGKLETRRYAFNKDTQIAYLGEASLPLIEPATDYRYSRIECGFPMMDISGVNGKYSFINGAVYTTPYNVHENVYDIKSVYHADPFAIELQRINFDGKDTTDNKNDNSMAFLDCERAYNDYVGPVTFDNINPAQATLLLQGIGYSFVAKARFKVLTGNNVRTFRIVSAVEAGGNTIIYVAGNIVNETVDTTIQFLHYKLRRKAYTITGIPNTDTVFNIELSVKRCLMAHYEWIKSACWQMENKSIIFGSADRNTDVVTVDALGVEVKEKEDVAIQIMGNIIYIPNKFTMTFETPLNLYDSIKASPGGYFSFDYYANLRGFIIEVKTDEATLATQQYTLLATPDNDFSKLIYR